MTEEDRETDDCIDDPIHLMRGPPRSVEPVASSISRVVFSDGSLVSALLNPCGHF